MCWKLGIIFYFLLFLYKARKRNEGEKRNPGRETHGGGKGKCDNEGISFPWNITLKVRKIVTTSTNGCHRSALSDMNGVSMKKGRNANSHAPFSKPQARPITQTDLRQIGFPRKERAQSSRSQRTTTYIACGTECLGLGSRGFVWFWTECKQVNKRMWDMASLSTLCSTCRTGVERVGRSGLCCYVVLGVTMG